MPRGASKETEREAVDIVRSEELAKGWTPGALLAQGAQAREGCDFLSEPPDGGLPHPVEVKGWGEPLLDGQGNVLDSADINAEQMERAKANPNWRLEIVANLTAARSGRGAPQRLTLTAADVIARARSWRYRVNLVGLGSRVREGVGDAP